MRALRHLAPPYRIVTIVAAVAGIWFAGLMAIDMLAADLPARLADRDFANYWTAARLVLEGRSADLFGPQPIYFAHLQAAFGPDYPWHNWSYPPHFLLLVWPLGFFGYKLAMALFLAVTAGFFLWALRAFVGSSGPLLWAAAGPFVVHNAWVGQNGFLTAGLALGALALRGTRPVAAGVLLGVLTVKPQLGLLFPLLLFAERRWTVIASAVATTAGLIALSAFLFGVDAWRGYLDEVIPYQALVMRELEGTFLAMIPSVYGTLRNWTVDSGLALAIHAALAGPIAIVAVLAFFRLANERDRAVVLILATFLVTPYALSYDLGLYAAALACLAASAHQASRPAPGLLAVAMLLPLLMIPLGENKLAMAPVVMLAVFILALKQAGFVAALRGPGHGSTPSSPAAL